MLKFARGDRLFGQPPTWAVALLGTCGVLCLLASPRPLAWAGVAVFLALALLRWYRQGRPIACSPFTLPLGLYLAGALIGLAVTVAPREAEVRFFGLLAGLGAFYLLLDLARSPREVRRCLLGLIGLMLIVVPIVYLLAVSEPSSRTRILLANTILAQAPILLEWRAPLRELDAGLLPQRIRLTSGGLGMLAALSFGLALGPLLAGHARRTRLLGLLVTGGFGLLVVASGNRGALLASGLTALIFGLLRWPRLWPVALLGTAAAGLLLAGIVSLTPLVPADQYVGLLPREVTTPASLFQRFELWQNALFVLTDFRYTGAGFGIESPDLVYRSYFLPRRPGPVFDHSHNIFLQSYLEQGLLGLAGLLGVAGVGCVIGWRTLQRARGVIRPLAISACAANLALLLCGLTEIGPLTTFGMTLHFSILAFLAAVARLVEPAPAGQPSSQRLVWSPRASGLLALLIGGLYLGAVVAAAPAERSLGAAISQPLRRAVADLHLNVASLQFARATLRRGVPAEVIDQELRQARGTLRQALAWDPRHLGVQRNLAAVALAMSDRDMMRRQLADAEKLAAPDDGYFFFQAGRLYRQAEDLERALAAWQRVDPWLGFRNRTDRGSQLVSWSVELVSLKRWEPAIQVSRAAIQHVPTEPEPYRSLRVALEQSQGQAAALLALQELTEIHPNVPWPYRELVMTYRASGQTEQAQGWQRRVTDIDFSSEWNALRRQRPPLRALDYD